MRTSPTIHTARLSIRPLALADARAVHDLWTGAEVRRFLWDDEVIPFEKTRDILAESERLMETRGLGLWAVMPADGRELLGVGGYWYFRDPPELELILAFNPSHWKRGFATEAGTALIRYGFDEIDLAEVRGSTDEPNHASQRLMERLGMRYERRAPIHGLDTVFYAAIPGTWKARPAGGVIERPGPSKGSVMHAIEIREERPEDVAAIREVNRLAFGQDEEGTLVDALRAGGGAMLSLVATLDGRVVGHIMYSPLRVGEVTGAALAPMAVLPGHQRRGIGSQLVRASLRRLEETGCPFVLVLGHAGYYPRFGFTPAREQGITCPWDVPDDVFLLLVLDEGRMASVTGQAVYRPEFSTVA